MAVKDPSAPGELERVRRFVNSGSVDDPAADQFASRESAEKWLRENGLLEASVKLAEADVKRLRQFREGLRLLLLAHAGEADPAAGWEQVRALAQHVPLRMCLGPIPGDASLGATGAGAEQTLGHLIATIYEAFLTGTWRRLKVCRRHSCLWAFYDHSKNGSGAWCDMAVCGNRAKAERRRQRSATTAAATAL